MAEPGQTETAGRLSPRSGPGRKERATDRQFMYIGLSCEAFPIALRAYPDRAVVCLRGPVRDVVSDCVVEKASFLGDYPHLGSQGPFVDVADVRSAYENSTLVAIVQA